MRIDTFISVSGEERVLDTAMVTRLEKIVDGMSLKLNTKPATFSRKEARAMGEQIRQILNALPEFGATEAETAAFALVKKHLISGAVIINPDCRESFEEEATATLDKAAQEIGEAAFTLDLLVEKVTAATVANELDVEGALDFRERALKTFDEKGRAPTENAEELEAMKKQLEGIFGTVDAVMSVMRPMREGKKDIGVILEKGSEMKALALTMSEANKEALLPEDADLFALIMLKIHEAGQMMALIAAEQEFTKETDTTDAGALLADASFMLKSLIGKVDLQSRSALKGLSVKAPELFIRNPDNGYERSCD
jgi:hypothetical protein